MMCGGGWFTAEAKCREKKNYLVIVSSIVIKLKLDLDLIYKLGHWFNQWVIGQTVGSNKKLNI